MKVDLGVFVSGSDVDGQEMDDVEGVDNLNLGLLLDDGIRMALWWKEPLTVSVS